MDWSSRYTATFGNEAKVAVDWLPAVPALRPRMKISPWPGPVDPNVTFGRYLITSSNVSMLSWLSCEPVIAWIVMGTSWIDSVRRWAVTMTVSMSDDEAVS